MFHGRIEPRMIQNDYLGLNMGPHLNDVFSGICVDFSGYPWVSFFSDRRQDLHLQDPTWSDSLHVTFTKAPSPWTRI